MLSKVKWGGEGKIISGEYKMFYVGGHPKAANEMGIILDTRLDIIY